MKQGRGYWLNILAGLFEDAYPTRGKEIDRDEAEEMAESLMGHLEIYLTGVMLQGMFETLKWCNRDKCDT